VYRIGRGRGAFSVAPMLLAGIAINAAAFAGIGMLSYVATDQQLRDLTFWNLGSMSRSTWEALRVTAPVAVVGTWLLLRQAAPLNALVLGQAEARHLGVDTLRVERIGVTAVALVVGALVSVTGVIGFVGLVAPHMIRLACGPDHRVVLPGAALLGAALVAGADTVARTALAPAELPLGTLTTALGVPFFLALIARARAGEQPGG
jgi:iron complex transport system permease protein